MKTQFLAPAAQRREAIDALFDPRSIAIVGASDNPEKYGNWLGKRALAGNRPAFLVNSRRQHVLGTRTCPSITAIDDAVDLAVIAVPAHAFEEAVDDAIAAGVKAIVGITANLGETGHEESVLQNAMAQRVQAAGSVMVGPNCLGVLDNTTGLDMTINHFAPGNIALLSQSGNVSIDLANQLRDYGLGISRFVSLGNQADLDVSDLIEACIDHAETNAIAVYAEGISDGRRFIEIAARAEAAGKPVVLLAAGRSDASARGAASHTGSMVSSHMVLEAACEAAGVEFVASPREAADLLEGLIRIAAPRGHRAAVFADGGGHASLASDALDAAGLRVDEFTTSTQEAIRTVLPDSGGTSNPVDTAGAGERDPQVFVEVVDALAKAVDVDVTLLTGYLGGYGEYSAELRRTEVEAAQAVAAAVRRHGSSFVAQLMFDRSPVAQALREGGVAVYRHAETAAWVLKRLAHRATRPSSFILSLPPAEQVQAAGDYWSSRQALSKAGVPLVPAVRVTSAEELERDCAHLGYPRVLKALGDEHKSDRGGVVLGVKDAHQQRTAFEGLQDRLAPPAVSVEEMADLSDAVELIVGVRRDPVFGPIVLIGAGGTLTEVLSDTACALGPITQDSATSLLRGLKLSTLLDGYRGKPAVNISKAAELISTISQFAAVHPEISEIECNPIAVTPTEAIALDVRIILDATSHDTDISDTADRH